MCEITHSRHLKHYLLTLAMLMLSSVLIPMPAVALGPDKPEPLCVQLKWTHQAQFAGLYVAKEKGLYLAQGLDVRFKEGGPDVKWQEAMRDKACPIGITNAHEIIISASKGAPVRAIAAINQVSPIVWFSLKKSGITSPRQFKGRKIALVPTGTLQYRGMMKKVHMDPNDVIPVPFSVDLTQLYQGQADVWSGYHPNLITRAVSDGYEVNIISPSDYGIEIYDDVIYASTELIEKHPEIVRAFLKASIEGWQAVIGNIDMAVRATMANLGKGNAKTQRAMLARTIPYIYTGEKPMGWMERDSWDEAAKLSMEAGLIKTIPSPSAIFTDRFIKEIQSKDAR